MDQNIIQIRDAFMLAKRRYELRSDLLSDIEVRCLFHGLINISNAMQLQEWIAAMRHSAFHYENPTSNKAIGKDKDNVDNVLGEVERIALELTPKQRAKVAETFARLGPVDLRIINYATSKYRHIFANADTIDGIKGITLRQNVAALLSSTDTADFNKQLEAVKEADLPSAVKDYVDFANTLSDHEREALLANIYLNGEQDDAAEKAITRLKDTEGYRKNLVLDVLHHTGLSPDFNILSLLGDQPPVAIQANILTMSDRSLAVRGDYARQHFPPRKLTESETDFYRHLADDQERSIVAKALMIKKNVKDER